MRRWSGLGERLRGDHHSWNWTSLWPLEAVSIYCLVLVLSAVIDKIHFQCCCMSSKQLMNSWNGRNRYLIISFTGAMTKKSSLDLNGFSNSSCKNCQGNCTSQIQWRFFGLRSWGAMQFLCWFIQGWRVGSWIRQWIWLSIFLRFSRDHALRAANWRSQALRLRSADRQVLSTWRLSCLQTLKTFCRVELRYIAPKPLWTGLVLSLSPGMIDINRFDSVVGEMQHQHLSIPTGRCWLRIDPFFRPPALQQEQAIPWLNSGDQFLLKTGFWCCLLKNPMLVWIVSFRIFALVG